MDHHHFEGAGRSIRGPRCRRALRARRGRTATAADARTPQEAEEPLRLWKACILFIARALRSPARGSGPSLGEILRAFDLRCRPARGAGSSIGRLAALAGKVPAWQVPRAVCAKWGL